MTIDVATFWSVVSAIGVAFAAMGGFIRYQTVKLNRCQEARVASLERQLAVVQEKKAETDIVGGQK